MRYLLDTCVVSELLRPQPDGSVIDWLGRQDEASLYLSVLTLGELQKGVSRLAEGRKLRQIQQWVDDDLARRFTGRILAIDSATATRWGIVTGTAERSGRRLPVMDSLLAASALEAGMTLVTRNTADFESTAVPFFDPWTS